MRSTVLSLVFSILAMAVPKAQGFTEIGAASGLSGPYYNGYGYTGGLSFVDFNRDGRDDLTFAGSGEDAFNDSLTFFLSTDSGFFAIDLGIDAGQHNVKQPIWVDIDNDGDLDFFYTTESGSHLYEQVDTLQFEDISLQAGLDTDDGFAYCASWADLDKDGFIDLLLTDRSQALGSALIYYRNLGNGQFFNQTFLAGLGGIAQVPLTLTTLDYDNDGWDDIYIGEDILLDNKLIRNNGNGTFTDVSIQSASNASLSCMSTTVGDMDNDGDLDIYCSDTAARTLLENNGDGTFSEVSAAAGITSQAFGWSGLFIDADHDMDLDLRILVDNQLNEFWMKDGSQGGFSVAPSAWGFGTDYTNSTGLAFGDYNNDGRYDILELRSYSPFVSNHGLWRNDFNSNHFISFSLQGVVSNHDAVGAVIRCYAGGELQMTRIGCGEQYASQNSFKQIFGISSGASVDSVLVNWPSGLETSLFNLQIDQHYELIEAFAVGCTDSLACNFDINAIADDGSCVFPEDFFDCEGVCINDSDGDGICDELEIAGCMDQLACNFDSLATDDDGSCYSLTVWEIMGPVEVELGDTVVYSYPENIETSLFWTVGTGELLSIGDSTAVTIVWDTLGGDTLLVTETDSSGCMVVAALNVEVYPPSSIGETAALIIDIHYAHGQLSIFSSRDFSIEALTLFDSTGRVIFKSGPLVLPGQFLVGELPPAPYLMEVSAKELKRIHRFNIQE